jgi:translation initiation factor IF-2
MAPAPPGAAGWKPAAAAPFPPAWPFAALTSPAPTAQAPTAPAPAHEPAAQPPPRSAPAAAAPDAGGQPGRDGAGHPADARLAERLAELEQRLAEIERRPAGSGAPRRQARRRRPAG